MEEMEQVIRIFPQKLREILRTAGTEGFRAEELRLRISQPLMMRAEGRDWWLKMEKGYVWRPVEETWERKQIYCVGEGEIRDTLEYMSRYSLYAFDEELRQGFLTIPGGHRVGVAGQAVLEGSRVKTLRNISFLNIRVAREIPGCGDQLLPWLYQERNFCSTLIISAPGRGKTTLLRDLIRQISDRGLKVGAVDERSEIGACCQGKPQNNLGLRTDLLDGCPKAEGIMMLIRSMSPQVIAVDEIGGKEDLEALRYGKNCGCSLLATVHGNSLEDIRKKPVLREFVEEKVFSRYLVLGSRGKPGRAEGIFDGEGNLLWGKNQLGDGEGEK